MKYYAEKLESIETKPGCWNYTRVGIFEKSDNAEAHQIGEFIRNYGSFNKEFYPFELNGKWYALYSKHYMYTRVMSLPDCKDLGGEDDSNTEYKNHFCPVEYFVPEVCIQDYTPDDPMPHFDQSPWDHLIIKTAVAGGTHYDNSKRENDPSYKAAWEKNHTEWKAWYARHPHKMQYTPFGFVSGCPWGMDHCWQVEFIDLKEVDKGIIKRDARFGWVELPSNVDLKDAIEVQEPDWENPNDLNNWHVNIAVPQQFNIGTGQKTED